MARDMGLLGEIFRGEMRGRWLGEGFGALRGWVAIYLVVERISHGNRMRRFKEGVGWSVLEGSKVEQDVSHGFNVVLSFCQCGES